MSVSSGVERVFETYISRVKMANTHQARLIVVSDLLRELFGVELEDLLPGIETRLGSKVWGLRGRADLIFSNVVFEVKLDLDRELEDAKNQLKKYLQALCERSPSGRFIGIATDGLKFKAYNPVIQQGQVVDLKEIGSIDVTEKPPTDVVLWLDAFVFSQPRIKPTAQDLKWRFGPGSPTYSIVIDELSKLWSEVKDQPDAKLKYDLWTKNMEIVYGSKPEEKAFIEQTYLVTLVKLVVYLKLSQETTVKKVTKAK